MVVFRADASLEIGNGHVMRCLTLADALRAEGTRCHFVCRAARGDLLRLIDERGYATTSIRATSWEADAAESMTALGDMRPDWVVVDHYGLDAHWEAMLRSRAKHIMVIDDLASRPHDCDLLLDQTAGRAPGAYTLLVPEMCLLLLGAQFALLRPEFAAWRSVSLARRTVARPRHILVSLGGVDRDDVTGQVLDVLADAKLPDGSEVTVILGPHAPWAERVRSRAASMPVPCRMLLGVANMAQWMAEADLAVGAAGSSAWERCCLGLPALMVVLADNQRGVAEVLSARGAAMLMEGDRLDRLPDLLRELRAPGALARMGARASDVCDGFGAGRVVAALGRVDRPWGDCLARPMRPGDLDRVRAWRNHPDVRRGMFTQHEIGEDEHRAWFERTSADPRRHLLVVEDPAGPLGFVHFTEADEGRRADWGFYVVPGSPRGTGRRLCQAALAYSFEVVGLNKVSGQVLAHNVRSIALHTRLGFTLEGILRDHHHDGGESHAVYCFGLLASEWPGARRETA
jgi:UDP-2,4-diacetamido-2,4,6-trideoxy-beta-L-altropyranose hydrolase/UDP-4-amino-4,6-dideoxy-N-acetyl-beta-L-altrosamine N-acetyltransferase